MGLIPPETMRIDKWLWSARFFKSRADAQRMVTSGRLRLNSEIMSKPHRLVKPDDVLTFPKADDIRVIKILAMATHRGPATETAMLYDDLDPPQPKVKSTKDDTRPFEHRERGSGRPTKRERRKIDRLKF